MSITSLNSVPLFIDLNDEELSAVEQSCTPRKYPKNSMVILEEEFGGCPQAGPGACCFCEGDGQTNSCADNIEEEVCVNEMGNGTGMFQGPGSQCDDINCYLLDPDPCDNPCDDPDDCGACCGTGTNNTDCGNSIHLDCNGECYGGAYEDLCGDCVTAGQGENQSYFDSCAGGRPWSIAEQIAAFGEQICTGTGGVNDECCCGTLAPGQCNADRPNYYYYDQDQDQNRKSPHRTAADARANLTKTLPGTQDT